MQKVLNETKLMIGGSWVEAKSNRTFPTYNPATEEQIGTIACANKEDVDEAVKAARKAFETGPWPSLAPKEKARLLYKLSDLMEEHLEELAILECSNNGRAYHEIANLQIPGAIETLRYYAGWATKVYGETAPSTSDYFNCTLREAVGVCAGIIPWNTPLVLAIWKLAPALACGNTVILKPAEQTSLSTLRLGELIQEAGFPQGVVNIVTGPDDVGKAISSHPDIDKIAFTGSTEVGREILKSSASNFKHVSLELGGKSPNIFFSDTNIEEAVKGALTIFYGQGQVCFAGTRIFVQEDWYAEFAELMAEEAQKLVIGPPMQKQTQVGPLISKEHYDRVIRYIQLGRKEADLKSGGDEKVFEKGYYVKPTIFTHVRNNMRIAQEEIFGPVACLIPFKDENDALQQANQSNYGLAAGIWTKDISRAFRMAKKIKTGTVWVNCYGQLNQTMPFGGYKESGIGRELGKDALDLYTQVKSLIVKI